jgi:hypothetical protein
VSAARAIRSGVALSRVATGRGPSERAKAGSKGRQAQSTEYGRVRDAIAVTRQDSFLTAAELEGEAKRLCRLQADDQFDTGRCCTGRSAVLSLQEFGV